MPEATTRYQLSFDNLSSIVDKKNTFIGALLFIAAFLVLVYSQKFSPQRPQPAEIRREVGKETASQPPVSASVSPAGTSAARQDEPSFTTAKADSKGATVSHLSNGFVQVNFTDSGGAIRDVAFKKYAATPRKPGSLCLQ